VSAPFRSIQFPCQHTATDLMRVEGLDDDNRLYVVIESDGKSAAVELSAMQAIELAKRITAAFSTTPAPWSDL
jgi:hypothetical protein